MSKTKWTDGWLCGEQAEKGVEMPGVCFYGSEVEPPELWDGDWERPGCMDDHWWSVGDFRKVYGPACLPKPGEMFGVRIQL